MIKCEHCRCLLLDRERNNCFRAFESKCALFESQPGPQVSYILEKLYIVLVQTRSTFAGWAIIVSNNI